MDPIKFHTSTTLASSNTECDLWQSMAGSKAHITPTMSHINSNINIPVRMYRGILMFIRGLGLAMVPLALSDTTETSTIAAMMWKPVNINR